MSEAPITPKGGDKERKSIVQNVTSKMGSLFKGKDARSGSNQGEMEIGAPTGFSRGVHVEYDKDSDKFTVDQD